MAGSGTSRKNVGFTLIELMITLVIAAILLAIAAPGFKTLLERNRVQTSASSLFASLMLARSEALKRNQPVGVCRGELTTPGDPDSASCTSGTDGVWEGGWLVHLSPTNASNLSAAQLLAVREGLKAGDTLRVVEIGGSSADLNGIIFRPDGGASLATSFVICNADADTAISREVRVGVTGRPSLFQSVSDCAP